ncbi:MAG: YkgJ family cysteine cluster protein, partial [Pseudomonadota bacterium]
KEQLLVPIRGGTFQFACHKNVPCFTDCCRDLRLLLTPYDIIRLKNRLGVSSREFLGTYTVSEFDQKMGLPIVLLKMNADEGKKCLLVASEGCTIYEDRPGACRVYPLGRAAQKGGSDEQAREHYFMVREHHCLGFREERVWTIKQWLNDQGIDHYNEMNDYWLEIITSRNPMRHQGLNDKKLQMFFMASYNLESFKEFVFSSTFLKLFEVGKELQEKIGKDEVELMKFACRWMKFSLFGEGTLKIKDEIIQTRKENTTMR